MSNPKNNPKNNPLEEIIATQVSLDHNNGNRKACMMAYRALRENPDLIHDIDIDLFSLDVLCSFSIQSWGHCSLEDCNDFRRKLRETGKFSESVCSTMLKEITEEDNKQKEFFAAITGIKM